MRQEVKCPRPQTSPSFVAMALTFLITAFGGAALVSSLGHAAGTGPASAADARCAQQSGRVAIAAGKLLWGEDGAANGGEAIPVERFWIDRHEVTNQQFAAFVQATGHVTQAERDGASAVFIPPTDNGSAAGPSQWWHWIEGANWRHPEGPNSNLKFRSHMPVVHVSRADAEAYARWVGGYLPTAQQWERAARGDQKAVVEPSRWAFDADGRARANVWEGRFPFENKADDGFVGLAPVGCFPANDFGLHDMVGNAWEWVSGNSDVGLIKGGSYLCASNYCANYRPAGFQAQEADLGTSHIGFRVAYSSQK